MGWEDLRQSIAKGRYQMLRAESSRYHCFDVFVELKEFQKVEEIQELIDKRLLESKISINKRAAETLLNIIGGNPRSILNSCDRALGLARNRSETTITLDDIKTASEEYLAHVKEVLDSFYRGLEQHDANRTIPEIL